MTDASLKQMASVNFDRLFNKFMSIKNSKQYENDKLDDDLQIHHFEKNEFEVSLPEITTVVPRFKQLPSEK